MSSLSVNDADEVQSSALVKLCQVLDKLRSEKLVWESFWIHSNGKLVKSIESLKFILDAFLYEKIRSKQCYG